MDIETQNISSSDGPIPIDAVRGLLKGSFSTTHEAEELLARSAELLILELGVRSWRENIKKGDSSFQLSVEDIMSACLHCDHLDMLCDTCCTHISKRQRTSNSNSV